jgi:DNA-binding response OmpR family regulator
MSRKKTIALLGDNSELAETLQLDLEEEGYDVLHLAGLKEDLKEIRDKGVDLLILDLDAPVWRVEFIKEVKRTRPVLPIILLSSFEENLVRFFFSEIEVAKTFIKPFELEEFSNSIKSILDSRTRPGPIRGEKNLAS